MINIEDFKKCDIRIGKVLSAEKVLGSEKQTMPASPLSSCQRKRYRQEALLSSII